MNNPYRRLGLVFCLAGAIFAPLAYFLISSVALTALGISALMIGFTAIVLANARPYISPEACQLILKTGMENTSALLEELGIKNKGIYLPSSRLKGKAQALVPLNDVENILAVREIIPGRMIVRYGLNPDDMAISVTTPGSINLDLLETKPGSTASEIETAANYILAGTLDLVNSVIVRIAGDRVTLEVDKPRLYYEDIWYYRCLGSPIASIMATLCSDALNKPVRIQEEEYSGGKGRIVLEVLSESL